MNKQLEILNILSKSGFSTRVGSSNISIRCPLAKYSHLHKNTYDSKPSMGIKVTETAVLVNCFTCGFKSGQLSYLYKKLAQHSSYWSPYVHDVLELEKEFLRQGLLGLANSGFYKQPKAVLKPINESEWAAYSNKFSKYLANRGITLDTGKRWGVGFDQDRQRALIPVRDFKNQLWGAVGRAVVERTKSPKYFNYWEFKKSNHLLGSQLINKHKKIVVVEGSIDAMKVDQALTSLGLQDQYGVVSILGSKLSEKQSKLLTSCSLEVVLALDNDEAGYNGTIQACNKLSRKIITKIACIGNVSKKDFADCTDEEIQEVLYSTRMA